jgi:hypothetical protein
MAQLDEVFSTDTLPESTGFDPIPAGSYQATIAKSEKKDTAKGWRLSLQWTINGPTHQGRVVFGSLNLKHENAQTEEISRKQLGELLRAIGLAQLKDTDQLVGQSCIIRVKLRPAKDGYDESNDVSGYKPLGEGVPKASFGGGASAPAAATPPWLKK